MFKWLIKINKSRARSKAAMQLEFNSQRSIFNINVNVSIN